MRKAFLFSILVSALFSNPVHAQKDFLPGVVVLNTGDSLQGYINYENWSRTPSAIEFRRNPGGSIETYTLQALKAFQIKGADKYQKAVIWKEGEAANFSDQRYAVPPLRQDTVFLRSIVEADKLSLYEYTGEKSHYYIRPQGDTLQQLLNSSVYNASTGFYNTRAVYRDQLKKYALGHPQQQKLFRQIDAAPYREAHLKAIVLQLAGVDQSAVAAEKSITSRQAFVAAGVIFSAVLPDSENSGLAEPYKGTHIQVSGGMDFSFLKHFQHLFLRTELRIGSSRYQNEVDQYNYRGELIMHQYDASYVYFNPAVHVLFPFLRTDNARLYAGVGFSYTFLKNVQYSHSVTNYGSNQKTSGPKDLYASGHGSGGTNLSLGWMYKKRFEVRAFHNLGGMLIPETTSKYNGLLLGYRF